MKVLILVYNYSGLGLANTICAKRYGEALKLSGAQVDFATVRTSLDDKDFVDSDSNIYFFNNYKFQFLEKLNRKVIKYHSFEEIPNILQIYLKIKTRFTSIFKFNTNNFNMDFVDISYCNKLIKLNNYNAIISVSEPFAVQYWGYKLKRKNKNVEWYPIVLDPYVYNYNTNKIGSQKKKKIAKKIMKEATHIFAALGIKDENIKRNYLPAYLSKMTNIFIPLLSDNIVKNNHNTHENIILLYSGMFHEKVRNPEKLIKVLERINIKNCDFYWFGCGCEHYFHSFNPKYIRYKFFGKKEYQELKEVYSEANCLIFLSNSVANQLPSKIFEYISYGKPIINFYFNDNDLSMQILKNYPLLYNFNLNNYNSKDIERLQDYIIRNANNTTSFQEVQKLLTQYMFPQCCDELIREVLNRKNK